MNHVTTKLLPDGKSRLVPALGDSWAHAATNRLLCYWKDSKRFAFLFKSPYLPSGAAEYRVSKDGIRSAKLPPSKNDDAATRKRIRENECID
jgi:RAD51-like protein 2